MDLGLGQKRALIIGNRENIAAACAAALMAEGATVACDGTFGNKLGSQVIALAARLVNPDDLAAAATKAMGGVDIVVTALDFPRKSTIVLQQDEAQLIAAWDGFTAMSALYRVVAAGMRERKFGRFIWTGPIEAKQIGEPNGEIDTIVGMGALGMHKVISGEMGPFGVTANSVLWDDKTATADVLARAVGQSVAWLASEPAAYVTGFALAVDGGRSQGLF